MKQKKRSALLMNVADNVASALHQLPAGMNVPIEHEQLSEPYAVQVIEDIPLGHKFALADIPHGQSIIKFGMVIGTATADIRRGAHVSEHNLE